MVNNRLKIVYIISDIDKSLAFEWIADRLDNTKFDLIFILISNEKTQLEEYLIKKNIPIAKFPANTVLAKFKTQIQIYWYLKKVRSNIIHSHLFNASFLGLLAGKISGIKKRIYTRHHSTYNHIYNPKGVYFDKLINRLATDIVAISKNVESVLRVKESISPNKIHLIPHGFDLEAFAKIKQSDKKNLKVKYNLFGYLVIGVIARWIEWKGIQYIIPAFKKLLGDYPNACLVLANAKGPYTDKINEMLRELPEDSYRIIPFENNLFALYQLFDVYVHVPIDPQIEAFGQTYVEALAAGIPSIFTLSGVAREFIVHEKNALVVPFKDSESIYQSIIRVLNDKELASNLIMNGKKDAKKFKLESMIQSLEQLYTQ